MKFSDNHFKELEEQLKIKKPHLNRLKSSICLASSKPKRSMKPIWIPALVLSGIMMLSFPFYSPALAEIVAKVKPLVISEQSSSSSPITTELTTVLSTNGYDVSSVGFLTKENMIEIGLEKGHEYDLSKIEEIAQSYLTEQGYDLYTIDIVEMKSMGYVGNPIYEDVEKIVKDVFAEYGYAKEADYQLASLQGTWFSNILLLDMPDHIEESAEIVESIEAKIEEQDLDVKKVEVTTFNLAHRILDNAWGAAASTIYNTMAAQSTYQLEGLSYSVKKGHAIIKLKTMWETEPTVELATEIEQEIISYLQSDEVKSYLPEPSYTIKFVNGEKTLLEMSNKK